MERDEYLKVFENGVSHIESAKSLADNEQFGFACSHLVLGIEELIKYQVVLVHSVDKSVFSDKETNPSNWKSIFRDHKTKHSLIQEFQQAISKNFPEDFVEYLFFKMTKQKLKEKHKIIEQNRFKEIGSLLSLAYQEINIPDEKKESFFSWLKNANDLKNDGFYVNTENEKMYPPQEIQRTVYETALNYATAILEQTKVIKDLDITEEEFINIMNSDFTSKTRQKKE